MTRAALCLILLAAGTFPAAARDAVLALPLDCTPGENCFIQNYVDADGGPGAADFTCGPLSYDGHKGTDFALPSLAAMRAGVTVRAAAPGRVVSVRDGETDISFRAPGAPDITGRECGNGVVIDHGGGLVTQYCHLKQGSVAVQPGRLVATGTTLGQAGMSGRTEFPSLHLSVRRDDRVVDPFNPDGIVTCGGPGGNQMWTDPIAYVPGGLVAAGFSPDLPDFDRVKSGKAAATRLAADAPALVLWAHVFGARAGDVLDLTITGPRGVFSQERLTLERTQARLFRAAGRKLHNANRAPGSYFGTVTLMRDGVELDRARVDVQLLE